jgi:hypothetical protein
VKGRPDTKDNTLPNRPVKERDSDRRYTDQEVALVLQRAAEIEERRSDVSAVARGLTLGELHEIAKEVGLSPDVIDEAVAAVRAGARPRSGSLLGAPLSSKLVRGVRGQLGKEDLQRLLRVIEEHVEATGTVTEALGTVRWTSIWGGHKPGRTMQVSLSAKNEETQIQVVQRYPPGVRVMLHALPATWGGMIGIAVAASLGVAAVGWIGLGVGTAAVGMGIGRSIWQMLAQRNAREVEQVASALATAANEMADR